MPYHTRPVTDVKHRRIVNRPPRRSPWCRPRQSRSMPSSRACPMACHHAQRAVGPSDRFWFSPFEPNTLPVIPRSALKAAQSPIDHRERYNRLIDSSTGGGSKSLGSMLVPSTVERIRACTDWRQAGGAFGSIAPDQCCHSRNEGGRGSVLLDAQQAIP
jgi:hypothetical protein